MSDKRNQLKDILNAQLVEFTVDQQGKIWVNIDGVCQLRIGFTKNVVMEYVAVNTKRICLTFMKE